MFCIVIIGLCKIKRSSAVNRNRKRRTGAPNLRRYEGRGEIFYYLVYVVWGTYKSKFKTFNESTEKIKKNIIITIIVTMKQTIQDQDQKFMCKNLGVCFFLIKKNRKK